MVRGGFQSKMRVPGDVCRYGAGNSPEVGECCRSPTRIRVLDELPKKKGSVTGCMQEFVLRVRSVVPQASL